jgi:hypothetical protein
MIDTGAAYTYVLESGAWNFHQKLMQPVFAEFNERFGETVAIESDRLIVGCPLDRVYHYPDSPPFQLFGTESGSAYLYEWNDPQWTFNRQLRAKDKLDSIFETTPNYQDHLASSAAISNGIVLLGATDDAEDDSCSNNWIGSAMVFAADPPDCDANGSPDTCDPDCNNNLVADQCDFDSGESNDCNANLIPDECETPPHYVLDDGTTATVWGAGLCTSFDYFFMNHFTVLPSREHLTHISIAWSFGAPANSPATLLVYDDPNNDGDPNDAVLLTSLPAANIDEFHTILNSAFTTYSIPRTFVGDVGDSFFVGVMAPCPHDTFIAMSSHTLGSPSQGRSWSLIVPLGTADIDAIAKNGVPSVNGSADWMIRGLALDCNGNGAWDQCDIDSGLSQDSNKDGVPDECQPLCAIADATGNGVIDVDDLLTVINSWGACDPPPSECNGDVTGNGVVDVDDLLMVVNNWGPCV